MFVSLGYNSGTRVYYTRAAQAARPEQPRNNLGLRCSSRARLATAMARLWSSFDRLIRLSSSPRIVCRCMPHRMLAPRCATRPASTSLPSRQPSRVEPSTTQLAATKVGRAACGNERGLELLHVACCVCSLWRRTWTGVAPQHLTRSRPTRKYRGRQVPLWHTVDSSDCNVPRTLKRSAAAHL